MLSLEQEVANYLVNNKVQFKDGTESPDEPDFLIQLSKTSRFYLEVKEKRQHTRTKNWPAVNIPEQYLFILDDLSGRKLLRRAPYSGLLVRCNVTGVRWFFNVAVLMLMPKLRVNRRISESGTLKGKWMIDLRNGLRLNTVGLLMPAIETYFSEMDEIFHSYTPCYGSFHGEQIDLGGEIRTIAQRQLDYEVTR